MGGTARVVLAALYGLTDAIDMQRTLCLSVRLVDKCQTERQRDTETETETNRGTDDIPGDIQFPARELNNLIALAMLRELLKHMAYVT